MDAARDGEILRSHIHVGKPLRTKDLREGLDPATVFGLSGCRAAGEAPPPSCTEAPSPPGMIPRTTEASCSFACTSILSERLWWADPRECPKMGRGFFRK